MYILEQKQIIPVSIETAWKFFSAPKNLAEITPPEMAFKIIELPDENKIFRGMKIKYKVRPVFRIPVTWVTHITEVNEGQSFIDFQEKGPFALWEHFHEFRSVPGGVEMRDVVKYRLPFGFLGRIAHSLFVKRQLDKIFGFRRKIINQKFGELKAL